MPITILFLRSISTQHCNRALCIQIHKVEVIGISVVNPIHFLCTFLLILSSYFSLRYVCHPCTHNLWHTSQWSYVHIILYKQLTNNNTAAFWFQVIRVRNANRKVHLHIVNILIRYYEISYKSAIDVRKIISIYTNIISITLQWYSTDTFMWLWSIYLYEW